METKTVKGYRLAGWYRGRKKKSTNVSDGLIFPSAEQATEYGRCHMNGFTVRATTEPPTAIYWDGVLRLGSACEYCGDTHYGDYALCAFCGAL